MRYNSFERKNSNIKYRSVFDKTTFQYLFVVVEVPTNANQAKISLYFSIGMTPDWDGMQQPLDKLIMCVFHLRICGFLISHCRTGTDSQKLAGSNIVMIENLIEKYVIIDLYIINISLINCAARWVILYSSVKQQKVLSNLFNLAVFLWNIML